MNTIKQAIGDIRSREPKFCRLEGLEIDKYQTSIHRKTNALKWAGGIGSFITSGMTMFTAGMTLAGRLSGYATRVPEATMYAAGGATVFGIGAAVCASIVETANMNSVRTVHAKLRDAEIRNSIGEKAIAFLGEFDIEVPEGDEPIEGGQLLEEYTAEVENIRQPDSQGLIDPSMDPFLFTANGTHIIPRQNQ